MVALGTFICQSERRLIAFRVWVFILIAIGVGVLWGLNEVGGFGGSSGSTRRKHLGRHFHFHNRPPDHLWLHPPTAEEDR
jgi:hypothetical protein